MSAEQLKKYGSQALFLAGMVVVMGMVLLGIGVVHTNVSPTDLGGGDEPIKYLQDSPPTPTPLPGSCPGNTGLLSPTSEAFDTGGDGDGFELNPTNTFLDDAAFASNIDGKGDRHQFYDYGISIPSECNIRGIEVRLDWWLDATSGTNSMDVELSWDGGSSWTAAKTDAQETTSEHTVTLGAAVDRWGRTWAISESNNTNFRVRLTSIGSNQRDFYVDWVPLKVHYGDAILTTGLKSPSAEAFDTGGDGDGFELNPTNAFADGGGAAQDVDSGTNTVTTCGDTGKDHHRYYDYGMSIPAGSAIHGIEVRLDAWVDTSGGNRSMCAELSWDGGTSWTAFRSIPQGSGAISDAEATFILGGGADDWGRVWSSTEFSDANFRVRLNNFSDSSTRDFFLDWVPVEVHYSPP